MELLFLVDKPQLTMSDTKHLLKSFHGLHELVKKFQVVLYQHKHPFYFRELKRWETLIFQVTFRVRNAYTHLYNPNLLIHFSSFSITYGISLRNGQRHGTRLRRLFQGS